MNKSVSELGRSIYATNKSCYDVIYYFQEHSLIDLESKKNIIIPRITDKGKRIIAQIIKDREL